MDCISERACVPQSDYDLARLENELEDVRLDRKRGTLVNLVWSLVLLHMHTLENCGYAKFAEEKPKLEIRHVMKRIEHLNLRKRIQLTLTLREREMEENFQLFVRELSKEAENIDRMDCARKCDIHEIMSTSNMEGNGGTRHTDRKKGSISKFKKKDPIRSILAGRKPTASWAKQPDRELPPCLNKKCKGRHFIDQCEMTSESEAKVLKRDYHESKKKREQDRSKGGIQSLSYTQPDDNTSLFSGTFCGGMIHIPVLADTGADWNAISREMLHQITSADPKIKVAELNGTITLKNPHVEADPVKCTMIATADIELYVGHGEKLLLRQIEWLVSEQKLAFAYIGRRLLRTLGTDTRAMMEASRNRFGSSIDVDTLMMEN